MQAESEVSILKKIFSATEYPDEPQWFMGIVSESGININTPSKRLGPASPFRSAC
jgi:hypothetical protein